MTKMKKTLGGGLLGLAVASALAQEDAVVITATRVPQPSLEVPASVDRLYADEIRDGRPQVNLSESLGRVPGIVVQNRQNYAQDLQISSRGFGARATFGVRGIRLIADGIPATMPDGQGQAATFALGSAERIEVLRGPFSSLYGNAAGGVIVVDTEDPPEKPTVGVDVMGGTYDTWRAGIRLGGWNNLLDASRFESDGYRDHSAVRRDHYNWKAKYPVRQDTSLALIFNQLRQPETQDPLGLSRAQVEDNPRQATPQAIQFNTRKTIYQEQLGATLAHRLSADSKIEATVYGGNRWVEQYLAIPLAAQAPPTSSGGVVQLDRNYAGGALRFSTLVGDRALLARRRVRPHGGAPQAASSTTSASPGRSSATRTTRSRPPTSTRRLEWQLHRALERARRACARAASSSSPPTTSSSPGNPDDSGTRTYSETTPVAGLLFRLLEEPVLLRQLRRGLRDADLRRARAPEPARDRAQLRARCLAQQACRARREDHFSAGRAGECGAFRHRDARRDRGRRESGRPHHLQERRPHRAPRVRARRAETRCAGPFGAQFAYTYLDATYKEGFSSTVLGNTVTIPAGNALPGVPKNQAYAQLSYRQPRFYTYLEALYRSRVPVNDANSEFADAYTVFNLVGALVQQGPGWRISEYVRMDNVTDRNYVGSVIVNEGERPLLRAFTAAQHERWHPGKPSVLIATPRGENHHEEAHRRSRSLLRSRLPRCPRTSPNPRRRGIKASRPPRPNPSSRRTPAR